MNDHSCLENSRDREAWQATVHGFAKSWTRLSTHAHAGNLRSEREGGTCFPSYSPEEVKQTGTCRRVPNNPAPACFTDEIWEL